MYKKILVPLDGSIQAEAILPHVEDLAKRYDATVIFFRVAEYEPLIIAAEPMYSGFDPKDRERRHKEIEAYLTFQEREFREKGLKAQTLVSDGPIAQEIINAAENEDVDLIAMASHGRTGLASVFYGSVAAGVLHRIDRPLLLIRSFGSE